MGNGDRSAGPVIDFGCHCTLDGSGGAAAVYERIGREIGVPIDRDMEAYKGYLEGLGADGAVLSQPGTMGTDDAGAAEAANDALLSHVGTDDYYGLASIPIGAGGATAAAEFERSLAAGLHGGAVETATNGIELVDEAYEPVFEVADRTEAPIFVHPTLNDSLGPGVLDDEWLLNATFGREVALAASICEVVHTGTFDRYPNLRLVFHHTGGTIGSFLGRYRNQLDRHHARFDRAGTDEADRAVKRFDAFREQLEEHVYVDTTGHDASHHVLRTALAAFPPSQLLFGTDFPHATRDRDRYDAMVEVIEDECPASDARRILGGNARALLGG